MKALNEIKKQIIAGDYELIGVNMERCNVCGASEFIDEKVKKVFNIEGEIIVVENIPAKVCKKCGEENFSRDTLVHIQSILFGKPQKYIQAKSYEYA